MLMFISAKMNSTKYKSLSTATKKEIIEAVVVDREKKKDVISSMEEKYAMWVPPAQRQFRKCFK